MDVRLLTAAMAIFAGQCASAIEAGLFVSVAVGFAGLRLDRTADDCPRYCVTDRFEIRHSMNPPFANIRRG